MKILFLHGWRSIPGGVKPTFLEHHGHEVINPKLPDEDFAEAVRIAQHEFDKHQPQVVVGSSRGGAVAMNIEIGAARLVLLCPAWKKWGTARRVKAGTVILHSSADDVVPFAHSIELVQNSGLPDEALINLGNDHRLADNESLEELLGACETSISKSDALPIRLFEIGPDGNCDVDIPLSNFVRSLCDTTSTMYKLTAFQRPWIGYLAEADGQIVGTCAFKTPPQHGRVEIAYFTFPEHEGTGIATQMARRLVEIAQEADSRILVVVQTLPQENASTAILRKLGFTRIGTVHHPVDGEVWEWQKSNIN